MKKKIISFACVFAVTAVLAQTLPTVNLLSKIKRLELKQYVPAAEGTRKQPSGAELVEAQQELLKKQTQSARLEASAYEERLDSMVSYNFDNTAHEKQIYTYNEDGLPLRVINYGMDSNNNLDFAYTGQIDYEYDEKQRIISYSVIDNTLFEEEGKWEYVWDERQDLVLTQVIYQRVDGNWSPYQKYEYDYDRQGWPTEQVISTYNAETGDWKLAQRESATYDADGMETSYFKYYWDEVNGQWVGVSDVQFYGQTVEFKDRVPQRYVLYKWVNSDWLAYADITLTYDDKGNNIGQMRRFWEPATNSWDGGDTYGTNLRVTNSFDSESRKTRSDVTSILSDGTEKLRAVETWDYSILENGDQQTDYKYYVWWKDGDNIPLYKETIDRVNDSVCIYLSYNYSQNATGPVYEERRYIDKYGNYHGNETFNYINGKRVASTNEWMVFPDDWDPTGHYTPIEITHAKGKGTSGGDSVWVKKDHGYYGYQDISTGVVTSWRTYRFNSGNETPLPVTGFDDIYDFSVPASQIMLWVGKDATNQYEDFKMLESTVYNNNDFYSNDPNWDDWASYHKMYYYSKLSTDGVQAPGITNANAGVAVYYDLQGRRLSQPAKGVNIVKTTNGKTRKMLVK